MTETRDIPYRVSAYACQSGAQAYLERVNRVGVNETPQSMPGGLSEIFT